jgi:hypothetical protein
MGPVTERFLFKRLDDIEAAMSALSGRLQTHIKQMHDAAFADASVQPKDRDYANMSRKDCYELGLLDGCYAVRQAIKEALAEAK